MSEVIRALAIYFGWMLLSMLCMLPLSPATMLAAKSAPPWLVALVGSVAAGLTAAFDHWLVTSAERLRHGDGRVARFFARMAEKSRTVPTLSTSTSAWMVRWVFAKIEGLAKVAPFWTTGLCAAFPLPFWVVRIVMPLSGYPRARYVIAVMLGRYGRLFVIAAFGTLFEIPNEILYALIGLGVAVAIGGAVFQRLRKPRVVSKTAEVAAPTSPP